MWILNSRESFLRFNLISSRVWTKGQSHQKPKFFWWFHWKLCLVNYHRTMTKYILHTFFPANSILFGNDKESVIFFSKKNQKLKDDIFKMKNIFFFYNSTAISCAFRRLAPRSRVSTWGAPGSSILASLLSWKTMDKTRAAQVDILQLPVGKKQPVKK